MNIGIIIASTIIIDLCILIYDYYYSRLTYKKYNLTIKKFIIYLITAIAIILIDLFNVYFLKQISHFMQYILPLLFFKDKIYNKIYYIFSVVILITMIDEIVNILSTTIINILNMKLTQSVVFTESAYFYMIITIIILLFFLLLIRNKKVIELINRFRLNIIKNKVIFISYIVLVILLYYFISYDLFFNIEFSSKIIILVSCLYVIGTNILLTYYYSNYNRYKSYTNNMIDNMKGNTKIVNDYRIEKHNINNFLLSLKDNNKELNKRIDNYLNNNNIKVNNTYNEFDIPYSIAGFITNKMNQYKCKYYFMGTSLLNDIDLSNPQLYNELCNAIGICIDNAYDALKKEKNKEIIINVIKNKKKINIEIMNKFTNTIDINQLGKIFYTTKEDGNGIGLFSINKSKYIKYNISIINNIFKITLTI